MLKKIILKFSRSLIKVFLPLISKILIFLKINRRVINFLEEQSYFSNKNNNFSNIIQNLLINEKIVALDVGAQGGFNSDKAYNAVLAIENIIDLRRLPVGLEVKILSPETNKTGAFTFKISKDFNLYAILDKDLNWVAFKASRPIRNEKLLISGEIKTSLYLSAQEVGLPEDVLMEFVQLMGYSVDFQRQIQPGGGRHEQAGYRPPWDIEPPWDVG